MSKYKDKIKLNKEQEDEMKHIIDLLFPAHEKFIGKIPIAIRRGENGRFKNCCYFKVGNAEYLQKLDFYKHCNYYMTSNTSKKNDWKKENLFSLNNIVIDIDCHNNIVYYELEKILDSFLFYANKDLIGTKEIPQWNVVHKTGRGLQLWWHFEQASVELLPMYKVIIDNFVAKFKELIEEYSELKELNVDTTASGRPLGLFRVAFTYNTHTKRQTSAKIISSNTYKFNVLYDKYKDSIPKEKTSKKCTDKELKDKDLQDKQIKDKRYINLLNKRVRILEEIVNEKNEKNETEGYRNNYLFLYFNSLRQLYDIKTAKDKAIDFNDSFKESFENINERIDNLEKQDTYMFSVDKFNEMLNLSEKEIEDYGLKSVKEQREENAIKKEKRNEMIIELASLGKTNREIAKEVGCTEKTIASILRAKGFDAKEYKKTRIKELKEKGNTQEQTANILNISISTVKRYWSL